MDKPARYTIFNTPLITPLLRLISLGIIKILGWKTAGSKPEFKKYILIVAPHTTNWDLLYGSITAFALRLDLCYMAKHQLFRMPFGSLMRWLGGIKVDRRESHNTVSETISLFNKYENLVIAVSPEGTRSRVKHWKTGFYHIATGANIPIVAAFINIPEKTAGVGPVFYPSGNIEKDILKIGDFYRSISENYLNTENLLDPDRLKSFKN